MDLLTGDEDLRTSVKMMRSRTWQSLTRAKMKVWHDRELGQVQKKLNATLFRTSPEPSRYGRYVDAVLEDWDALWGFAAQRKVRKLRFRASADAQRALDREVDRLCASRPGDNRMLLLYGNGASTSIFGRIKVNVKGQAKTLFDAAVRRKKAVCVWADEFRTPKLDVYGHPVHHPRETRAKHLQPPACKTERHATDAPGWLLLCAPLGVCSKKDGKSLVRLTRQTPVPV